MSWALEPSRVFLNDANRGRFSHRPPPPEWLVGSPGPFLYTPREKVTRRGVVGAVSLKPTKDERATTLSDGTPVGRVSPVGPGAYEAPSMFHSDTPPAVAPFNSKSPRSGNMINVNNGRNLREYIDEAHCRPAPGTYDPRPVGTTTNYQRFGMTPRCTDPSSRLEGSDWGTFGKNSTQRSGGLLMTARSAAQSSTGPLATTASDHLASALLASMTPAQSPRKPPADLPIVPERPRPKSKGFAFSRTKRHLNLRNVNSLKPETKDDGFDFPAPGNYNLTTVAMKPTPVVSIGRSPRNRIVANQVPGPGSYHPINGEIGGAEYTI